MTEQQEIIHPQKLPDDTHHVIVKLEAIHVNAPEVDTSPYTHETIEYEYTAPTAYEITAARIREASIILTTTVPVNAQTLGEAPYLKCVITETTGTNHIDLDECRRRGVTVFYSPDATMEAVSEHALAMYFTTRRRLLVLTNAMSNYTPSTPNAWKASGSMSSLLRDADGRPPHTCQTETVGILGYGPIGRRIATLCQALSMRTLVAARKDHPRDIPVPEGRTPFHDVLRTATVLFVVVPHTPETANFIAAPELAVMRSDAVLINVGRGGTVDEVALLAAVREGRLYGAATDVFATEPVGSGADSVLVGKEVRDEGLNVVLLDMSEWHDPSCRRLDLIRFDGTASCMSCGSIAPDIDSALDDLVAQDIYQPIEGKTEFRLLILEPGEFNDPLQCRLYTASTLDAPTYDAMSYTWADETGDATKSSTVRLDAQPFPVTKNCESAMKRVRRQYSPRTIWIDAICVDQMNDRERGHQVQLMPQIYSKAREVFVYIGELESVSEKHFLQDLEVGKIDWSAGGQTSLIPKMLERRYFSRVWVLQEVALAKQATLICGDHTMPWLSFARSMLRRAPEFTIPRLPAVLRFEKRTYRDWGSVLELLDFARETDASDARDKIYAVFGLVACAESEGLVADYTVPVEVANLKMACWITQRYGLLLLIARTHSLSDLDSPGLRWVPDWSRRMARDKLTNLPRASSIGVNSPTKCRHG
ncbi:hypothetical protein ACHAQA_007755 [Verticillium albo-atrum]